MRKNKLRKYSALVLATVTTVTLMSSSLTFASTTQTNGYTHGSDDVVTEDMLKTIDDIPDDYDVNTETQAKAKSGVYEKLFDTSTIQDVNINIDSNNWNYMLQNAIDKPTVLTDSVTIGDETVEYAGIKTKGNLTLSSVWNSDSDRFSFTVNFGKYITTKNGYSDKQNFYGLSKVAFNDIYGDATLMKEYLSYQLMTEMGVDTPYYCLVNLYVNGEFYGVYMMVESIDSALSQRTIGEKSDYLVKPESSGGDLVYDDALDQYLVDGEFVFDTTDYPTDSSNPLYKYNGLWENDEDTFADVVDMLPTVFKWMKTLNELSSSDDSNSQEYQSQLESIMNVDEIIRYFAVNTYLVNLDSYQSEKMQNYALYINENGYMNIFPWDYNFSFGAYGCSNAESMINFNIYNPVLNTTLDERPLLNVILQNDDYKALYEQYLQDCCTIANKGGTTSDGNSYESNYFSNEIETIKQSLTNYYSNDPTAFYTVSQYEKASTLLGELISLRSQAVEQQLSGDTSTVTSDINLSDLGSSVGGGMGAGEQLSELTLTDNATGISVTGMFANNSTLNIQEITEGKIYNNAVSSIGTSDDLSIFSITVSSDQQSGGEIPTGEIPTGEVPTGEAPTGEVPTGEAPTGEAPTGEFPTGEAPTGEVPTGEAPTGEAPTGEAPTGDDTTYTISFPVTSSDSDTYTAYLVSEDGTTTKLSGTIADDKYTVTSTVLGYFALVKNASSAETTSVSETTSDQTTVAAFETSTTTTSTSENDSTISEPVNTGDNINSVVWLCLVAVFCSCVLVIFKVKKAK